MKGLEIQAKVISQNGFQQVHLFSTKMAKNQSSDIYFHCFKILFPFFHSLLLLRFVLVVPYSHLCRTEGHHLHKRLLSSDKPKEVHLW